MNPLTPFFEATVPGLPSTDQRPADVSVSRVVVETDCGSRIELYARHGDPGTAGWTFLGVDRDAPVERLFGVMGPDNDTGAWILVRIDAGHYIADADDHVHPIELVTAAQLEGSLGRAWSVLHRVKSTGGDPLEGTAA